MTMRHLVAIVFAAVWAGVGYAFVGDFLVAAIFAVIAFGTHYWAMAYYKGD